MSKKPRKVIRTQSQVKVMTDKGKWISQPLPGQEMMAKAPVSVRIPKSYDDFIRALGTEKTDFLRSAIIDAIVKHPNYQHKNR